MYVSGVIYIGTILWFILITQVTSLKHRSGESATFMPETRMNKRYRKETLLVQVDHIQRFTMVYR